MVVVEGQGSRESTTTAAARRPVPIWLLLLVAATLLIPPATWTSEDGWRAGDTFSSTLDPWLSFPTAASIVHDRDASLDEYGDAVDHYSLVESEAGARVDDFPWVTSLLLVPPVLALDGAELVGFGDGSSGVIENRSWGPIQVLTAVLLVLISVNLAWGMCVDSGLGRRTAILMVLCWSVGTMVWSVAGRGLWQHTVLLVPLLLLLRRLHGLGSPTSVRVMVEVGALAAVAVLIRPAVVPMVAVLVTHALWRTRWRGAWIVGSGLACSLLGLVVTVLLYDGALPPYLDQSGRLGWHDDAVVAVASLLGSASRNAFMFAPILVLSAIGARALIRGRRWSSSSLAAFVAGATQLIVSTALWDGWWGGFSYGPRFVVDVLPLMLLPAITGVQRIGAVRSGAEPILAGILALGLFVNAPGALTHQAGCWNLYGSGDEVHRMYDWSDPQFAFGYRELLRHGADALVGPCDVDG